MNVFPRRVDFLEGYPVKFRAALNRGVGKLITLSEGGAYVATPSALLPQAQLSIAIEIPELRRTFEVEAVVAWENRGAERPSPQPDGYGLRFIRIPTESAEAIRWLLRREEPIGPVGNAPMPSSSAKPAAARGRSPVSVSVPETRAVTTEEVREALRAQGRFDLADSLIDQTHPYLDEASTPNPPYPLNVDVIEAMVPPSTPGVFVVGYDRTFDARIGRADVDLRRSLEELSDRYGYFHFEIVHTRKDRFERECELFHRLGGDRGQLDNEEHPLPPPGPQLKCPICVKG